MINMTLINILSKEITNTTIEIEFKINPEHNVFKGHFPGNPIVPGVLEMQIAETILLDSLSIKATLFNVSNVKFSKPIYPNNISLYLCQISYTINEGFLECTIFIKGNFVIYMSMQCKYKIESKHNFKEKLKKEEINKT
jgi:3-hydroxyacyl-[acyl-carrier-protein] dehydratase